MACFTYGRFVLIGALVGAPATVSAQAPNPVTWSARVKTTANPGTTVPIAISAQIERGWHVYSLTQPKGGPTPLRFSIADASIGAVAGNPRGPKPRVETQSAFDVPVELYDEGTNTFTVPFAVNADAPNGRKPLVIRATWQACSPSICLLPRSQDIPVDIDVRRTR